MEGKSALNCRYAGWWYYLHKSNNSGWFISSRDGESVNKRRWNV